MIRAVLFDLDETLFDRTTSIERYMRSFYERYARRAAGYPVFYARFIELDRHGYGDRAKSFRTLIREFALPITLDKWMADFPREAWGESQCFPDAYDVIDAFRGRGCKLGIITNGSSASQRAKIRATKLDERVDVILVSGEEGIHKPAPELFLRATEQLQVSPEACLFVGDNPVADVLGAQGAGMQAAWVERYMPWPAEHTQTCHTIDTLTDLLTLPLWDVQARG